MVLRDGDGSFLYSNVEGGDFYCSVMMLSTDSSDEEDVILYYYYRRRKKQRRCWVHPYIEKNMNCRLFVAAKELQQTDSKFSHILPGVA